MGCVERAFSFPQAVFVMSMCVGPPWVDNGVHVCVPPGWTRWRALLQVGKAQHIQFDPLRAHPVSIPAGGVCVVANSLVEASKVTPHLSCSRRVMYFA